MKVNSFSPVQLFATPWTVAYQALLSMDFPGMSTGVDCHFLLQQSPCTRVLIWQTIEQICIFFFLPPWGILNSHIFFITARLLEFFTELACTMFQERKHWVKRIKYLCILTLVAFKNTSSKEHLLIFLYLVFRRPYLGIVILLLNTVLVKLIPFNAKLQLLSLPPQKGSK